MQLLTTDRLIAASNISRWRGWVKKPYSILDHTVIGTVLMAHFKYPPDVIRAWMLHDIEETEFMGDVATPHKRKYCNDTYFNDVSDFVVHLYEEQGVPMDTVTLGIVGKIDEVMLRAEYAAVSMLSDPTPRIDDQIVIAMAAINMLPKATPDNFWALWLQNKPKVN